MTTYLLDVNVLIALIDRAHVHHARAADWFGNEGRYAWASCPIVENGVMRIVSHPSYPNRPSTPAVAAETLIRLQAETVHVFWPDDISLLQPGVADWTRLLAHGQMTDSYLLALAKAKNGRLATLDRRLVTLAIPGGAAALFAVP